MGKILIKNANLISMAENEAKIQYNIDILIQDNEIIKICKNKESIEKCEAYSENDIKIIDASGKFVMPGLINTHSHVGMSIFRETADGLTTQQWLTQKIWPMEEKLTEEDVYYASYLSFIEMILTGTTTTNDLYYLQNKTLEAAKNTGIRIQLTRCLMDSDGNGKKRFIELENFISENINKYDRISLNVGIHGLYTNSKDYIKSAIDLAKTYKLPIQMHFAENAQEVQEIKEKYLVNSPVEVLKKYFKDTHLILAHAVKLTDNEIEELSNLNVHISHCPVSNLKLGCGIAKVNKMLNKKINVSLGTDGQGSGCNLDMFETIKIAALLPKGIYENPLSINSYDVLKMATINGAKALKLDNKIGTIEVGKLADIIILDLNMPNTLPNNDIISQIVYNIKSNNIETTIVNGKILMDNKKIKLNTIEIYKKCEEIINRIK